MRTHTDVDPEIGLRGVETVQAAADAVQGKVAVEQVAFPQSGVARSPGTLRLLRQAVEELGARAVGGIDPAGFDGDPREQLRGLFKTAE